MVSCPLSLPGLDDYGSCKRVYTLAIRRDVAFNSLLHNGLYSFDFSLIQNNPCHTVPEVIFKRT